MTTSVETHLLPAMKSSGGLSIFLLALALLGQAGAAMAQYDPMPLDQRREMRRQMREHWQQMPDDQRGAYRERFREERMERRDNRAQMPPEDRQRMREEMRSRRDYGHDGRQGPHGDGRGRH